jgi:hypothetical protein
MIRSFRLDRTFGSSELKGMEQTTTPWAACERPLSIAELRAELGMSLAELGARVGLSKSQMHDVERRNAATLRVALALEEMAPGRIDAAAICEDVRLARHGAADSAAGGAASPGNVAQCFPSHSNEIPGRALSPSDACRADGLAPEGTSGGLAGLRNTGPANVSQGREASPPVVDPASGGDAFDQAEAAE